MSKKMPKLYKLTVETLAVTTKEEYLLAEDLSDASKIRGKVEGETVTKIEAVDYAPTPRAVSMYLKGTRDED